MGVRWRWKPATRCWNRGKCRSLSGATSTTAASGLTSGEGGEVILENASAVLRDEFPELAIRLRTPDEKDKRYGQAVAAASLPKLK